MKAYIPQLTPIKSAQVEGPTAGQDITQAPESIIHNESQCHAVGQGLVAMQCSTAAEQQSSSPTCPPEGFTHTVHGDDTPWHAVGQDLVAVQGSPGRGQLSTLNNLNDSGKCDMFGTIVRLALECSYSGHVYHNMKIAQCDNTCMIGSLSDEAVQETHEALPCLTEQALKCVPIVREKNRSDCLDQVANVLTTENCHNTETSAKNDSAFNVCSQHRQITLFDCDMQNRAENAVAQNLIPTVSVTNAVTCGSPLQFAVDLSTGPCCHFDADVLISEAVCSPSQCAVDLNTRGSSQVNVSGDGRGIVFCTHSSDRTGNNVQSECGVKNSPLPTDIEPEHESGQTVVGSVDEVADGSDGHAVRSRARFKNPYLWKCKTR